MDVLTIVGNLSALQSLSRIGGRPSAYQKMTVTRLRRGTPPAVLEHFDTLLARGQKGVAEVRSGVCSGCYLRLPTSVTLGATDELLTCETCGAYLAFAHEESPAELSLA